MGEGDAGGGGLAGGQHAGEVQLGVSILQVELIHGGGEVGAVVGVREEPLLQLVVGDEVVQGDGKEERFLLLGTFRTLSPYALQGFQESEGVIAGLESGFHPPGSVFDPAGVTTRFFCVGGLLSREGEADVEGE